MFTTLTLRGRTGSLVLGYKDAVVLGAWSLAKVDEHWTLKAEVLRTDRYLSRLRPLLFTAPRPKLPPWCWGVERLDLGPDRLVAVVGPPEV